MDKDIHHNILKDGKPKTKLQKFIALNYLWVCVASWVVAILIKIKWLTKKQFNWTTYFWCFIITMPQTMIWSLWSNKTNYGGWNGLPFHTLGKVGKDLTEKLRLSHGITIEDILFFTGSMTLFYTAFRLVQKQSWKDFKCQNTYKGLFWAINFAIVSFFLFYGKGCGVSLSLMYGVPALLINLYVWRGYNFKKFFIYFLIMLTFEVVWDWSMVTWIHKIPGMSWACGWFYISFDVQGVAHYANWYYMDWPTWWIFENPIEITPYYGIVGAYFGSMSILAVDKFIKNLIPWEITIERDNTLDSFKHIKSWLDAKDEENVTTEYLNNRHKKAKTETLKKYKEIK